VGDPTIRVARARAAVRLVGEVCELGPRTEAGRQHLIHGMLDLVGCAIGGAVLDTGYGAGMKCGIAAATLGGFDREIMEVFQAHHVHGSDFNPFHAAVMGMVDKASGQVFTYTNRDLVASDAWDRSVWINDYVRPARVAHFLGSVRIIGATAGIGCGFMRAAGDRPFTDEDREVLHLVHLGIGAFFDVERSRLTPRMREALEILLTGASDKEIAAKLAISHHTARQYVKAILRVHNVSSRSQLIARRSHPTFTTLAPQAREIVRGDRSHPTLTTLAPQVRETVRGE
jgi:DNA-binding CsgD family transcriptional regulator